MWIKYQAPCKDSDNDKYVRLREVKNLAIREFPMNEGETWYGIFDVAKKEQTDVLESLFQSLAVTMTEVLEKKVNYNSSVYRGFSEEEIDCELYETDSFEDAENVMKAIQDTMASGVNLYVMPDVAQRTENNGFKYSFEEADADDGNN